MDKSLVKEIVEANIKQLQKLLGLELWDIVFEYHMTEDDNFNASCLAQIEYLKALITINPEQMEDKAKVLQVLTHELVHCLTSTFRTYQLAVANLLDRRYDTEKVYDAVNEFYNRAEEEVVCNFCRILERTSKIPLILNVKER